MNRRKDLFDVFSRSERIVIGEDNCKVNSDKDICLGRRIWQKDPSRDLNSQFSTKTYYGLKD